MMYGFEAELTCNPFGSDPSMSEEHYVPFKDDDDFEAYDCLGRADWVTPKVTFKEKYQLLAEMVSIIRQEADGLFDELLINSKMPSSIGMPAKLFGDDIFFLEDTESEAKALTQRGKSCLVLQDGIVRHLLEAGENRIKLTWRRPPEEAQGVLDRIQTAFEDLGFAQCLSDTESRE